MESDAKQNKYKLFTLALISFICILFWIFFLGVNDLLSKIMVGFFAILLSLLIIYNILFLFKDSKLVSIMRKVIGAVFSGMFLIIMGFSVIAVPIIILIVIFVVQILLYYLASQLFGFQFTLRSVQLYFMYLISVLVFSYWGKYALKIFNKIFNEEGDIHNVIRTFTKRLFKLVHFRRRAYELMILLYIISVIEKFSQPIFSFPIWTSLLSVSLEVLLTFIAIDSYIQCFKPSIIDKSNEY